MTINDLDAYRRKINHKADPADVLVVEMKRETADYFLADIQKRAKRVGQAAQDPNTKPAKRAKRAEEHRKLEAIINAIQKAELK